MRIRTCCQLALLLAGTAAATAATAMPSALPASLMRTLPERTAAVTAIEAQPLVLRARGEKAAALARADGRQRGPHDWIAGGQWQSRDAGRDGRFGEWELSLQRGVRLPAKAGVDRRMAGAAGTAIAICRRHTRLPASTACAGCCCRRPRPACARASPRRSRCPDRAG